MYVDTSFIARQETYQPAVNRSIEPRFYTSMNDGTCFVTRIGGAIPTSVAIPPMATLTPRAYRPEPIPELPQELPPPRQQIPTYPFRA